MTNRTEVEKKLTRAPLAASDDSKVQKTIPSFMRLDDADYWAVLRADFGDAKAPLQSVRLETRPEGEERAGREGRRSPTVRDIVDTEVVKFQGPAMEDVEEFLETARECIPTLEMMFQSEAATPEFLTTWGAFQLAYGFVMDQKDALKAAGTKKADFIKTCRAEADTPAAPAAASAPAPTPAAASPAPTPAAAAPKSMAPPSATEAQLKAKCPTDTIVWVNTKSGVYHFAGTHNYGTTKKGTYMCEMDAKAAGDRAAENEKHP